jgi:hypothetical protein
MKGWRYFLGKPHGWVALVGVCLAGQFFTARHGRYDWVENADVGAVITAGLVTAARVPRELQLAALLVSKGVVVGLLLDVSVRATGPAHDEVAAGWLAGAVLGAGMVVFAGTVLEQREASRRMASTGPAVTPTAERSTSSAPGPLSRSPWPAIVAAACLGAAIGSAARRGQW